ncbi:MAG: AAA family ATPase [Patescibacteria group bacterium]
MNKEAIEYIQNQLNRSDDRLRPYVFATPTFTYPERHAVIRIKKYVKDFLSGQRDFRWVVVPGLRGVGKTTVMAQVFLSMKRSTHLKNSFLYMSVDDLVTRGLSLNDAIDAYESILGKPFEKLDFPILFFIDEVQQDKNWAAILKSLHDRAKNSVFIFCTGSSALSLQSNPDVARRAQFEKLYPLSFGEYEMIKNNIFPQSGLKEKIKDALYGAKDAEDAYTRLKPLEPNVNSQWSRFDRADIDEYLLNGTLPFTLKAITPNTYDNINILLDRIIDKDIKELGQFDTATLSAIKRLLFILADSDVMSVNKVSSLVQLSYNTVMAVLDALEKAELMIRVPAQGSKASQARKPAKYLFMSPALRSALLSVSGVENTYLTRKGKYLEDIAALHFYREFVAPHIGSLTHDPSQGSADFIIQIADKKQIAFEVGLGRKNFEQVKITMKNFKMDFGVVVCPTDLILSKEDNVLKMPLGYFLLM